MKQSRMPCGREAAAPRRRASPASRVGRATTTGRVARFAVVLLVVGVSTSCLHFVRRDPVAADEQVVVGIDELAGARLIEGMTGCENIWLAPDSVRAYVTSLTGPVYLLNGPDGGALEVVASLDVGGYALGIDSGPDGNLYVGVAPVDSSREWKRDGGAVCRIDPELRSATPVTDRYPSLNGLAFDDAGWCYFASSNFSFLFPRGAVYRMQVGADGSVSEPVVVLDHIGLANGVFFDSTRNRVLVSDTLETVVALDAGDSAVGRQQESRQPAVLAAATPDLVYRKAAFREAFDDLCVDTQGRLWMTDPIRPTLKVYDPVGDSLMRIEITGFGQASSCRIRVENGREVLYVTELVAPERDRNNEYNGRGVLRVPIDLLI